MEDEMHWHEVKRNRIAQMQAPWKIEIITTITMTASTALTGEGTRTE
jgi:hypothetical protein